VELKWSNFTIRTARLTAGGLTVLEALSILQSLSWDSRPHKRSCAFACRKAGK